MKRPRYRPNRVVMGTSAVWIGILVAHVTFCLLFGGFALFLGQGPMDTILMTAAGIGIGLVPATFIGWGLGMPLGLLLRTVPNQWLHVAAFGVLGVGIGLPFGALADPPSYLAAAGLGLSSALGRFSIWTFVRVYDDGRQDAAPAVNDDGGPPAAGTEVQQPAIRRRKLRVFAGGPRT